MIIIANINGEDKNAPKEVYTPQQVMEKLYISKSTVYDLLRTGKLEHFKIGKHYRIRKNALDDFISATETT